MTSAAEQTATKLNSDREKKRDCVCPRVRHQHGTTDGYCTDGCRCPECSRAVKATRAERERAITAGEWLFNVPAVGSTRRLQALAALGWSKSYMAQRCGIASSQTDRLMLRDQKVVHGRTAAKVRAAYDALWDKQPPQETQGQRRSATIARAHAAARGWVPPLAWDDDEIDDPTATPHMPADRSWDLRPCGTHAAYRRHQRRSERPCDACRNAENRRTQDRKKAA